jgi:hypothetical protein
MAKPRRTSRLRAMRSVLAGFLLLEPAIAVVALGGSALLLGAILAGASGLSTARTEVAMDAHCSKAPP